MSDVLIDQDTMEDIGDSIRSKLGVQTTYLPSEMPNAIMSISGGGDTLVIQDASIYSEDEQQIGIWIDGKPLYQKTIDCGLVINDTNEHNIAHNISNIEKCISCDGVLIKNNEEHFINAYRPTQTMGILVWRKDANIGYRNNWLGNNEFRLYVTLLYTKTTDTAGSGGYKAYGLSPIIYSEEEREVGVWTDGKPLYQKTFNFVNVTTRNSWVSTNHNISNIDKITDYNAIFTRTSDDWTVKADHYEGSSTAYISSNADKTQIHFKIAISSGTYNGSFTIRYTKTTDQPGSGIWTTTGEYAHHYSTDEHVIGTWIDGKPLYEKTLYYNGTMSTTVSLPHGVSNFDRFIDANGAIYRSNVNGYKPIFNMAISGGSSVAPDYSCAISHVGSTSISIEIGSGIVSGVTNLHVTIRYTKTT